MFRPFSRFPPRFSEGQITWRICLLKLMKSLLHILIDKDETRANGLEIRLRICLKEIPCDEVYVEKAGMFRQYEPPDC
jgi:hypothetical protein